MWIRWFRREPVVVAVVCFNLKTRTSIAHCSKVPPCYMNNSKMSLLKLHDFMFKHVKLDKAELENLSEMVTGYFSWQHFLWFFSLKGSADSSGEYVKVSFLLKQLCVRPSLVNLFSRTLFARYFFFVPGGGFLFAPLCTLDTGCNSVGMGDGWRKGLGECGPHWWDTLKLLALPPVTAAASICWKQSWERERISSSSTCNCTTWQTHLSEWDKLPTNDNTDEVTPPQSTHCVSVFAWGKKITK